MTGTTHLRLTFSAQSKQPRCSGMSSAEDSRVSGNGPSLIQAGLGFTLSLVALVGCVIGLGLVA